jgi:hypothetical protein
MLADSGFAESGLGTVGCFGQPAIASPSSCCRRTLGFRCDWVLKIPAALDGQTVRALLVLGKQLAHLGRCPGFTRGEWAGGLLSV